MDLDRIEGAIAHMKEFGGGAIVSYAEEIEKALRADVESEVWRFGWDFPTDSESMRELGQSFDKAWRSAVAEGRAADEDVSPGERLILVADKLKRLEELENGSTCN